MTTQTPKPVAAYAGWLRLRGQRWLKAVTAPTEDETWKPLRQHVESLGARFVDSTVTKAGVDPSAKPAMRRRF